MPTSSRKHFPLLLPAAPPFRQGGHSVPEEVIRRRFDRGLRQFGTRYKSLLEDWLIFDNSGEKPKEVAHNVQGRTKIIEPDLFDRLQRQVKLT
jgi:predicted ABC-type ATPase